MRSIPLTIQSRTKNTTIPRAMATTSMEHHYGTRGITSA
jgi:hypothetical protein